MPFSMLGGLVVYLVIYVEALCTDIVIGMAARMATIDAAHLNADIFDGEVELGDFVFEAATGDFHTLFGSGVFEALAFFFGEFAEGVGADAVADAIARQYPYDAANKAADKGTGNESACKIILTHGEDLLERGWIGIRLQG
jgi:hypothetical protein